MIDASGAGSGWHPGDGRGGHTSEARTLAENICRCNELVRMKELLGKCPTDHGTREWQRQRCLSDRSTFTPHGHTCSLSSVALATRCDVMRRESKKPPIGLEPMTCGLQNRCSTN